MGLISKLKALSILGFHASGIRECILGGWDDYTHLPIKYRAIFRATARAVCVSDLIKNRISLYQAEHSELRIEIVKGMFLLLVKDQIAVRFKKLNEDLLTANNVTDQVEAYKGQKQLPGLPIIYNLEAGYQLDPTEQQLSGVFLTCPNGTKRNYWDWTIGDKEAATNIIEGLFDEREAIEIDEEAPAEVIPRKTAKVVSIKKSKQEGQE